MAAGEQSDRSAGSSADEVKVLVVDDYAPLRTLCGAVLRMGGYLPVTASSADEAVLLLRHEDPPSVVITDLNMPGTLSGGDLVGLIRSDHPGIAAIVMSGDWPSIALHAGAAVLLKPFTNEQLLDTVAQVLADRKV